LRPDDRDYDLDASRVDYAELIYESPAAGFLPKEELSATAIRRILGRP
jgi:hypothetical protein